MVRFLKDIRLKQLKGKRVLLRADFNVVVKKAKVTEGYRIDAVLPTIKFLLKNKAKIILISHLGRPNGKRGKKYTLKPAAEYLSGALKKKVYFLSKDINIFLKPILESAFKRYDIVMLENLRFFSGEEKNSRLFAKTLAYLSDIYVNDAFGVCHRKHASVSRVAEFLPSYAGFLLEKEITVLSSVLSNPKKPLVSIIGGAKLKTKVPLIQRLWDKTDHILLGGAVANAILFARGLSVGQSKINGDIFKKKARLGIDISNLKIHLPVDAIVAKSKNGKKFKTHSIGGDLKNWMILDIGPDTVEVYKEIIRGSKMIVWNGPMGYYENPIFGGGTEELLKEVGKSGAFSIIGGGDTIAIINKLGLRKKINHISTGGGAMLEFLSEKKLPGIEALKNIGFKAASERLNFYV